MKDGIIKGDGTSRLIKTIADFKSRYPTYEAFCDALVSGTLPIDIIFNESGWSQLPDFLNKANLLKDTTASAMGLGSDAVPDDAFLKLTLGLGNYGYVFTVTAEDGTPLSGAKITGVDPLFGSGVITDSSGMAIGVSKSNSIAYGVESPYVDLASKESQSEVSSGSITRVSVILEKASNVTISTSGTYSLSPFVDTYDLCAVGGGGGAASNAMDDNGYGGGGGYVKSVLGIKREQNPSFDATIGAGGKKAVSSTTNATKGGTTKASSSDSVLVQATGGNGAKGRPNSANISPSPGTGNGNGGRGVSSSTGITQEYRTQATGGNGSGYLFDDPELGVAGGGGGAGSLLAGDETAKPAAKGGSPSGASGSAVVGSGANVAPGTPGIGGGGGGGVNLVHESTNGGAGAIMVRCHYTDGSVTQWTT